MNTVVWENIWLTIWSSLSTGNIIPCSQYSGTFCLDKYKVPPIFFSSWVSKCTSFFAAATYRGSPTKTKCLLIVFLLLRLLPVPWRARWGWSQPLLCRYFLRIFISGIELYWVKRLTPHRLVLRTQFLSARSSKGMGLATQYVSTTSYRYWLP